MPTHEELDWNVSPSPRKSTGDINSPNFSPRAGSRENAPPKHITGTESTTGVQEEAPPEPEVRLLSAEWKPGPEGFQYNKPCLLEVKGEYLTKTIRAKVTGQLFGTYNGEEYDLLQEVEGFLEKDTGIANLELKHLWFIGEHYGAWRDDKSTPCSYKIKGISHSRGENVIESPVLEMPKDVEGETGGAEVHFVGGKHEKLEDVNVVLTSSDGEIYSGVLPDGVLSLENIVNNPIDIECTHGDHTINRQLQWSCGNPPFPVQLVSFPPAEETEGAVR